MGTNPKYSEAMAELAAMRARGDVDQSEFEAARDKLRDRYGVADQPSPDRPRVAASNKADGGKAQKLIAWIITGLIAYALLKACSTSDHRQAVDDVAVKKPDNGLQCFSAWDGSSRELVRMVTERLRDPDSFKHVETKTSEPKNGRRTVLMEYRAKNGFGGYNVGYATGEMNISTCAITDFSLVGQ
ncbi:SHOCT domain-containing protein [Mesorhizobium sp. WSM3859]|uniref:SHOCT domain-containing protein n=1 Tax=Mesorhizobium sp. WSM3859 TaxID=2029402 RepID=UPI001140DB45|nr:SHOCT domain-containing protein [Mesorhizobium sp. WSM3859]